MGDSKKEDSDNWVKMPSESRPGLFYMFNKATGQTQWLMPKVGNRLLQRNTKSSPKIDVPKTVKTPAQDRLKRLQHSLRATQNHNHNLRKNVRQALSTKVDNKKDQENYLDDQPSTSRAAARFIKPRKTIKTPQCRSLRTERTEGETEVLKASPNDEIKTPELQDKTTNAPESTNEMDTELPKDSQQPEANNDTEENHDDKGGNTSTFGSLTTGLVQKLKEICKYPFHSPKKESQKESPDKNKRSSPMRLNETHSFKARKRLRDNQKHFSPAVQNCIIRQLTEDCEQSSEASTSAGTSKSPTPPTYKRGSVNSRLQRFKSFLSLQKKKPKTSDNANTTETLPTPMPESDSTTSSTAKNNENNNNNDSDNSSHHTANDEPEAMDWQPIVRDDERSEKVTNSTDSGFVIEKSKKCQVLVTDLNDNQTLGDIYDTVNENLLRYSAEQNGGTKNQNKWKQNFYYFVVDTNVLINDLTFVDDLTRMRLCDTEGSILYIPYIVLQELDKLKMRSGEQEGVKTLAVRAIKYLNQKLQHDSSHIQAQSALDERNHLIDVNSADDSILNCCLQAKNYVKNVILLTEDINLRNKAISNNILVSTKSDLLLRRYNDTNTSDRTL